MTMTVPFAMECVAADDAVALPYDIGVWVAGYETRASWLVSSRYRPAKVDKWYRVEFAEDRKALAAARNLRISMGAILGDDQGSRDSTRHWLRGWASAVRSAWKGRPLHLFLDISSMPRTIYGTLLYLIVSQRIVPINSVTMAYVPGVYSNPHAGTRQLSGLRSLIGTEGGGRAIGGEPVYIFGLGFDGPLVETIAEIYQVGRVSSLVAIPGVSAAAESEAVFSNRRVLEQSEHIATASARDVVSAFWQFDRLVGWYRGRHDVVLIPLGPKTHVVAGVLLALCDSSVALRAVQSSAITPVDVHVASDAEPVFFRISFHNVRREPQQYGLFSHLEGGHS